MNRTERLFAISQELRAAQPGVVSATTLAKRLEVSVRTVQRDLEALMNTGLPVWVQRGQGGGYGMLSYPHAIDGGFSADEVVAIAVALHRLGDSVFAASARSALRKIHQQLAPEHLAEAQRLADHIRIAPRRENISPTVRHAVAEAVRKRKVVSLTYRRQNGEEQQRRVEAQGLLASPHGDYLAGWCLGQDAGRIFRIDRIVAAYATQQDIPDRDLSDLMAGTDAELAAPALDGLPGTPDPARAREICLARIMQVTDRVYATAGAYPEADVRPVLTHAAEWLRWHIGALCAAIGGDPAAVTGTRPDFPPEYDSALEFAEREQMIQAATAGSSLPDVVEGLGKLLTALADWLPTVDGAAWRRPVPEPTKPNSFRLLADCLIGWWSPLSHLSWHLDRLGRPGHVADAAVISCPLG